MDFVKNTLLPLAGLDTAGVSKYFQALAIKNKLNYARNEAARGLVNGTMSEPEAEKWLMNYCLMNEEGAKRSIRFIQKNRSYVINYNYGQDMVKHFIEQQGGTDDNTELRWKLFGKLLSNEVSPGDLQRKAGI